MTRPIVFLTDYGLADGFVGVCHGVIARIAPDARVIDLTHQVARQDVGQGALALARSVRYMPEDAVYLAVVDPGVGTERRPVAVVASSGAVLIGPDNGLLSLAWAELGGCVRGVEIAAPEIMLHPVSRTFHGRDIFSPAAAHVASGTALERLGPALNVDELATIEVSAPMVAPGVVGARVVGVDGFGNVQLNAGPDDLDAAGLRGPLAIGRHDLPVVRTFSEVSEGHPAVIVDSQGMLAVVVNRGSAARTLGLRPGDGVTITAQRG